MIIFGVLTPEEALVAIDFDTIFLLLSMMLLVSISAKSGLFSWLNVRIASLTRGNPLLLFLLFSFITAIFSAFLDNVSTIILIVPLTIELLRGMGKDPKPFVIAEIFAANIGGGLTLIGDASNIIIGGATDFTFLEFVKNLWIPITFSAIFVVSAFIFKNWKSLKPVKDNMVDILISNILIRKIQMKFLKKTLHVDFIVKVVVILFLTFAGFFLQKSIGLPNYIIAITGALLLAIFSSKRVSMHEAFGSVEWTTLFFFSGLFMLVAGVEQTGVLENLSLWIANSTSNIFYLSLLVLWISGFASMLLDNIPFVTVMIPVIMGIQAELVGVDTSVLWWALSLGACLGGTGTLVGASANVVAADIASKNNMKIKFLDYMKFSLPLAVGMLTICSIYLFFRTSI